MTCSEINFVTSQCIYAVVIAYPGVDEDAQIDKAIRMAQKIIFKNAKYTTKHRKKQQQQPIVYGTRSPVRGPTREFRVS